MYYPTVQTPRHAAPTRRKQSSRCRKLGGGRTGAMDRLLTAEEIAEQLGVTPQWVWAQARAGLIPHVRLGRYRRFRESAVEAWLCELETGGTTSKSAPRPAPRRRSA